MTGPAGSRILVVDDDAATRLVIRKALEREGFRVLEGTNGQDGVDLAIAEKPSAVVLDVMMPTIGGVDACRELRRVGFVAPILLLTSRTAVDERVTGLEAGADDYVPKPFHPRELLARIHAQLRRHGRAKKKTAVLSFGAVEIDLGQRTATRGGQPLSLTPTEFAMLELLVENEGKPVSREQMLDAVWGYTRFPTTRTVDTHIYRLRRKIGDDGDRPHWLRRVQSVGYVLRVEPSVPA